jgi:hypothetical protein
MLIGCPIAEVMHVDLAKSFGLCALNDRVVEWRL